MLPAMSLPEVRFGAADAYPDYVPLTAALRARDWLAVRALVDPKRPADRFGLLRKASDEPGVEDFLRGVLARDPDDSAAAVLLGEHLIQRAWTIRTGYRARHVSRDQFDRFHAVLREAEMVLVDSVAHRPDDPGLWASRLTTARGLELGRSESQRRYDRMAALDPHFLPGQLAMLQNLCPKWSGTWELVFAFARESAAAAPAGSPNHVLIADVHVERWVDMLQDHGADAARAYLASAAVRDELDEAAQCSVRHPEFRHEYGWDIALSTFAFVFYQAGNLPAAASMFQALGSVGCEHPWRYLPGDAGETFRKARDRALSRIGAAR